mgnify:CR=1 FL=1
MILTEDFTPISLTIGSATKSKFDLENWFEIHRVMPQEWIFVHTHPEGICEKSHDDDLAIRAIATACSPYEFYFVILTKAPSITYTIYKCRLESFEEWVNRGKKGVREVFIRRLKPENCIELICGLHRVAGLLIQLSSGVTNLKKENQCAI